MLYTIYYILYGARLPEAIAGRPLRSERGELCSGMCVGAALSGGGSSARDAGASFLTDGFLSKMLGFPF